MEIEREGAMPGVTYRREDRPHLCGGARHGDVADGMTVELE